MCDVADPGHRSRSKRELARAAALVIVVIIGVLFAVVNTGSVTVNWLIGSGGAPLIVVIAKLRARSRLLLPRRTPALAPRLSS